MNIDDLLTFILKIMIWLVMNKKFEKFFQEKKRDNKPEVKIQLKQSTK